MASSDGWSTVFNKITSSIWAVDLMPKEEHADEILSLAKRLKANPKELKHRRECGTVGTASTGFVVGTTEKIVLLVTSAHSLQPLYTPEEPLSLVTCSMFDIGLLCDHYEQNYQEAVSRGSVKYSDHRRYSNGDIIGVDSTEDLLLLSVEKTVITNFGAHPQCQEKHNPLVISEDNAEETRDCMMVSWPSHHPRTISKGSVGPARTYDGINIQNYHGYNMDLLEVYMGTKKGSSGGPLFNKNGEVLGMLHGGFGENHSYFVAGDHINSFLEVNGVPTIPKSSST